jgi:hypothetical protein
MSGWVLIFVRPEPADSAATDGIAAATAAHDHGLPRGIDTSFCADAGEARAEVGR